jgi:tryptophan-rich sensory protein
MKKILKRKTVKIAVKNNYVQLFGFVAGTVILGSAGVIFTNPAIPGWYRLLNKPVFSPPNWIFGPVWTILFILMGFSIYRIYRQDTKNKPVKEAVIIYCLQFFFNLLWSFLFF